MNILIRQEQVEDYGLTERVVKHAFINVDQSDHKEHLLVAKIRKSDTFIPELSLVAMDQKTDKLVGHILLSKIKINNSEQTVESLALAPVSVLSNYQKRGIGKLLITQAFKQAKDLGYTSVIVLGHPEYYPKSGFRKAAKWGIKAPFEVSNEAFMAVELHENALENVSGVVEYPSVFLNKL